jgi:hypothetical protein
MQQARSPSLSCTAHIQVGNPPGTLRPKSFSDPMVSVFVTEMEWRSTSLDLSPWQEMRVMQTFPLRLFI